jgi:hypothetical protein
MSAERIRFTQKYTSTQVHVARSLKNTRRSYVRGKHSKKQGHKRCDPDLNRVQFLIFDLLRGVCVTLTLRRKFEEQN